MVSAFRSTAKNSPGAKARSLIGCWLARALWMPLYNECVVRLWLAEVRMEIRCYDSFYSATATRDRGNLRAGLRYPVTNDKDVSGTSSL